MRFILAVLALVTIARPASAADDSFCSNYAYQAQQLAWNAQDEGGAIVLGHVFGAINYFGGIDGQSPLPANCGFSGPRWSTNWDDHYAWCRLVSEDAANAEAAARSSDYQYCGVCIAYVNAAASLEKHANDLICPLRGARWPTEPNALLQFCLAQGHSDIGQTVAWLNGVLDSGKSRIAACERLKLSRPAGHRPPVVATPARHGPRVVTTPAGAGIRSK
jgi:hypothetical protein